ncbi:MAG: AbrB/MazE/SpoVT family DNA-binding domain-containing protein [Bacillota bacterium]|nr:AbrB/MazE/SpoVT family DNA-binding domain-containing protein [Candidatus Fermentithermobacillaceae bacterium]
MTHILRNRFLGSATVGERGQIVIPAGARREYGLEIGDKIMVFASRHGLGLMLIKAEHVTRMLSDTIDQLGKIVQASANPDEVTE